MIKHERGIVIWSALAILILVALLVLVSGLYVQERAADGRPNDVQQISGSEQTRPIYEWKMVTSWPKNFPGLGAAPENFARLVKAMRVMVV